MDAYEIVAGAALLAAGWLAGAESASWLLDPAVARLRDPIQVDLYQGMLRIYGRTMATLTPLTLVPFASATILAPDAATRAWCGGAMAATGLVIVSTVAVNLPINRRIETWDPEAPPPSWRADRQRRRTFQGVRVVLLVAASACVVVAVSL